MLHDFLNFVMAFSSSVEHVKNPYLRGKLLKVYLGLQVWRDWVLFHVKLTNLYRRPSMSTLE